MMDTSLVYKFWKLIMDFTLLNTIVYIMNMLGVVNFYGDEAFISVQGLKLQRSLEGFLHFYSSYLSPITYQLKRRLHLKIV